jgi:hypothetical protein
MCFLFVTADVSANKYQFGAILFISDLLYKRFLFVPRLLWRLLVCINLPFAGAIKRKTLKS